MKIAPDFERFAELAARREYDIIPVERKLIVDMESPLSIFHRIDKTPHAFLLESVERGEKWGRYSFMASAPRLALRSSGRALTIEHADGRVENRSTDNPLEDIRRLLAVNRSVPHPEMRFAGGAVGYLAYDMIRFIERIPDANPDPIGWPDCWLLFTDTLIVHDNMTGTVTLIANARPADHASPREAWEDAVRKIDRLAAVLRRPADPCPVAVRSREEAAFVSNVSQAEYERGVERAKEHIRAGDIFQLVLSQRFTLEESIQPFDLYRALRLTNPSPYMFFLRLGDSALVGSSPEVLVRLSEGRVAVRPIAGTRRRDADAARDRALEADMLADPKERAEHIMLVDLGRNDVGRVSRPGTVRVDELMGVERYSQVMHLVSNVTGEPDAGKDAIDVFKATFPAGTLTGAPKIRAMEIIDALETLRRGPYGGAVGYFDYAGNMDLCIAIRTFVVTPGAVHVQAGAGIVADSRPEMEHQECCNKARALFKAVELLSSEKGWE